MKIQYLSNMKNKKSKVFICPHCKETQDHFGIVRQETHYYSVLIETSQWKDESEYTELGKYYCLNCDKKIDHSLIETKQ